MDPDNNVQAEDRPAEKAVENTPLVEIVSTPAAKKGIVDRALPWVIVGIVSFLIGALLTWFVVYQPKALELASAQVQMTEAASTAAEKAAGLQSSLDTANADLAAANANLASAQATIEAQTTLLAKTELLKVIYKFQSDVNVARASLSKLDPASSRQALSFVASDLTELEKAGLDPDALSGFKAKIEDALANLETAPDQSLADLETIYSNLLLLINNLK
jgi:multidrug efflux pump subunit AcrA (membrane-fusion protein)